MSKRVLVVAGDLVFRAKLGELATSLGAAVTRGEDDCDLAVVEIGGRDWDARVRRLTQRGVPVLAFGPHVHADRLRTARELGARAVPNSQVEAALRGWLGGDAHRGTD